VAQGRRVPTRHFSHADAAIAVGASKSSLLHAFFRRDKATHQSGILMRTADLLKIVGMTSAAFTAVIARDVLPFERSASGGWSKFQVEEAIRLALFIDLTAKGMSQGRASALIRGGFYTLLDFLNSKPAPPPGLLFFGEVVLRRSTSKKAGGPKETAAAVCGVTGQLDHALVQAQQGLKGNWDVVGLTIVSASHTMDRILPNFIETGLATPDLHQWAAFMRAPGEKQKWRGSE